MTFTIQLQDQMPDRYQAMTEDGVETVYRQDGRFWVPVKSRCVDYGIREDNWKAVQVQWMGPKPMPFLWDGRQWLACRLVE